VSKLDPDFLILRVGKLNDLPERLHLRVFPQTAVFWCYATLRLDSSSLYKGKARSALDDPSKVSKMPCRLMPIFGRVLAKR
jgi:hypothetical protein